MDSKKIGKIQKVAFGLGGYQEAQLGLSVTLGSDQDSWGVTSFDGFWANERSDLARWTEEDQNTAFAEQSHRLIKLLSEAKVSDVNNLKGKPVECVFEGSILKSWRILTEVI